MKPMQDWSQLWIGGRGVRVKVNKVFQLRGARSHVIKVLTWSDRFKQHKFTDYGVSWDSLGH